MSLNASISGRRSMTVMEDDENWATVLEDDENWSNAGGEGVSSTKMGDLKTVP